MAFVPSVIEELQRLRPLCVLCSTSDNDWNHKLMWIFTTSGVLGELCPPIGVLPPVHTCLPANHNTWMYMDVKISVRRCDKCFMRTNKLSETTVCLSLAPCSSTTVTSPLWIIARTDLHVQQTQTNVTHFRQPEFC